MSGNFINHVLWIFPGLVPDLQVLQTLDMLGKNEGSLVNIFLRPLCRLCLKQNARSFQRKRSSSRSLSLASLFQLFLAKLFVAQLCSATISSEAIASAQQCVAQPFVTKKCVVSRWNRL